MVNLIFKSRPNRLIKHNDEEIWISRSGSVNGIILAIHNDNVFVLIEKRSDTMRDEPGKLCIPCGYFDWDENGCEAVIRETYQETGLYLPEYKDNLIFNNDEGDGDIQPFYVDTSSSQNRQNLSMFFVFIYDFTRKSLPDVDSYKNEEIAFVKWMPIINIFKPQYIWAFGHDKIIEKAITKFAKYLI